MADGRSGHNVGQALAQHAGVDLLAGGVKGGSRSGPGQMAVRNRLTRTKESQLMHQGNIVHHAGELSTLATVLAMVKEGFFTWQAGDGLAPHGRVPKMRAARVLA